MNARLLANVLRRKSASAFPPRCQRPAMALCLALYLLILGMLLRPDLVWRAGFAVGNAIVRLLP